MILQGCYASAAGTPVPVTSMHTCLPRPRALRISFTRDIIFFIHYPLRRTPGAGFVQVDTPLGNGFPLRVHKPRVKISIDKFFNKLGTINKLNVPFIL